MIKYNEQGDTNMTTKYWIYWGLRGGGFASRMKGIIFDNLEDAEAFVKEKEQQSPNAEFTIITKNYPPRRTTGWQPLNTV